MENMIEPNFYTRPYNPKNSVAIRDRWQSFLYIKNGATPLDLYVDKNDNLVMVFDKKDTKDLYIKYRNYELK